MPQSSPAAPSLLHLEKTRVSSHLDLVRAVTELACNPKTQLLGRMLPSRPWREGKTGFGGVVGGTIVAGLRLSLFWDALNVQCAREQN